MQSWLPLQEFASVVGKDIDELTKLCDDGELACKVENGVKYIEVKSGSHMIIAKSSEVLDVEHAEVANATFIEKTIGTIINLHEKVVDAKDETLEVLRRENKFLKDGLISMQEIYDEDRKIIETLQEQLRSCQEELEFTKRKYKLMWGQIAESQAKSMAKPDEN